MSIFKTFADSVCSFYNLVNILQYLLSTLHLNLDNELYDSIPGDPSNAQEDKLCQKHIPRQINYSEVSMEFTLMNQQDSEL